MKCFFQAPLKLVTVVVVIVFLEYLNRIQHPGCCVCLLTWNWLWKLNPLSLCSSCFVFCFVGRWRERERARGSLKTYPHSQVSSLLAHAPRQPSTWPPLPLTKATWRWARGVGVGGGSNGQIYQAMLLLSQPLVYDREANELVDLAPGKLSWQPTFYPSTYPSIFG